MEILEFLLLFFGFSFGALRWCWGGLRFVSVWKGRQSNRKQKNTNCALEFFRRNFFISWNSSPLLRFPIAVHHSRADWMLESRSWLLCKRKPVQIHFPLPYYHRHLARLNSRLCSLKTKTKLFPCFPFKLIGNWSCSAHKQTHNRSPGWIHLH